MISSRGLSYNGNRRTRWLVTIIMKRLGIMRPLFLFLLGAVSAFSQPITAGLKAGVPLTDFINTVQNVSASVPNRYIIGATAEIRLPAGFAIEGDVLYRHLNYTDHLSQTVVQGVISASTTTTDQATSGSWEFPVLLKYRFPTRIVRLYADAGVAWDTLSGLTDTITQTILPALTSSTTSTSKPASLANNTTMGFVIGAGVDVHALVIHISPEIRYTRWASPHFNLSGVLNSNQNQAEFFVGITF